MKFVVIGSLASFVGVALGAFGAHGLRGRVSPEMLSVWQTGVLYHLVHALGLLLVGILCRLLPGMALARAAGWMLLVGILLFSGSLFAMTLTGLRVFGAITPIGGVAFLIGWLLLAAAALREKS